MSHLVFRVRSSRRQVGQYLADYRRQLEPVTCRTNTSDGYYTTVDLFSLMIAFTLIIIIIITIIGLTLRHSVVSMPCTGETVPPGLSTTGDWCLVEIKK